MYYQVLPKRTLAQRHYKSVHVDDDDELGNVLHCGNVLKVSILYHSSGRVVSSYTLYPPGHAVLLLPYCTLYRYNCPIVGCLKIYFSAALCL